MEVKREIESGSNYKGLLGSYGDLFVWNRFDGFNCSLVARTNWIRDRSPNLSWWSCASTLSKIHRTRRNQRSNLTFSPDQDQSRFRVLRVEVGGGTNVIILIIFYIVLYYIIVNYNNTKTNLWTILLTN